MQDQLVAMVTAALAMIMALPRTTGRTVRDDVNMRRV